jgi:hypothetical protein
LAISHLFKIWDRIQLCVVEKIAKSAVNQLGVVVATILKRRWRVYRITKGAKDMRMILRSQDYLVSYFV